MMCPFLIKYKYPTHVDLHLREHVKKIASFFSKFYETKEYENIVCDIFARVSVKNFKTLS